MNSKLYVLALAFALISSSISAAPVLTQERTHLPLAFERDGDRYLARGQGYAIWLASAESTIAFKAGGSAVSLEFLGAHPSTPAPGAELPGKINLIRGADPRGWKFGICAYDSVRWASVYSGIDIVYYGNQNKLEFDVIVNPGGNPDAIRMKVRGADKLSLDAAGALHLGQAGPRLDLPQIYQQIDGVRKPVKGRFVLAGNNEVSFHVDAWDRTRDLVIDPTITYSTLLGGDTNSTGANGVAVDASGNMLITGFTYAADFPAVNATQGKAGGSTVDAFVSKVNAAGTALLYSTYFGGSAADSGNAIAVDSAGAAWVTGYTASTDFPLLHAAQSASGGNIDAFVAKFSSTGALQFSTYLGGAQFDYGYGVAVDGQGNGYVVGSTGFTIPTTAGAFHSANLGGADAFVTKYNSSGSVVYSTMLGGNSTDVAYGVAVDSSGNAYVAGATNSTSFVGAPGGGAQASNASAGDAFVAKVNAAGTALTYFTFLGGAGFDNARSIAVDADGYAYVAGDTNSTGLATAGAAQTALGGGSDGFVAKLDRTGGAFSYFTYLGGNRQDFARQLTIDGGRNVYVAGYTDSTSFPLAGALQAALPINGTSLLKSVNAGVSFSGADANITGAVLDLSINPGSASMVAATEAGLYKGLSAGGIVHWSQQSSFVVSRNGLARSPVASGTIYGIACCGSGFVYKSIDDGSSWSQAGFSPSSGLPVAMLADPAAANIVYVVGDAAPYVFRSTDGGLTWNASAAGLPGGLSIRSIVSTTDGAVYVNVYGSGVYKSSNQGASWSAVNSGLPGSPYSGYFNSLAASGTTLYFANDTVYRTTNGGISWTPMSNAQSQVIGVSQQNPAILYAYTYTNQLRQSVDGGATFGGSGSVTTPAAAYYNSRLLIDPTSSSSLYLSVALGNSGFVTKLNSTGGAFTWSTYLGDASDTQALAVAADANSNVYVAGRTNGQNFPATSTAVPSGSYAAFVTKISDSTAPCSSLSVTPSNAVLSQFGETRTFTVVAPSGCSYAVSSNQGWAAVTSGGSGLASGVITVQAGANPAGVTRTAMITAGFQSITISQPANTCSYSVDKSVYPVAGAGGALAVSVTAPAGCPWAVTNNYPVALAITSGASGMGNGTINLAVSANPTSNTQYLSMYVGTTSISIAQDGSTVTTSHTPTVLSIAPAVSVGSNQSFTFQFADVSGAADLTVMNVLINTALDGRQACYLAYVQQGNVLYLVSDAGDGSYAGTMVLNGTGSLGNSQCTIFGSGSSTSISGNTLTLTLNIAFAGSFSGNRVIYMAARDSAASNSGWQTMGVHSSSLTPSTFPAPISVSPTSGATVNPTLTLTYQDANSANNLMTVWALINTAIDGRGACYVAYYRPSNELYLVPDSGDGTQSTKMVLNGGGGSVANSQCTVSAQGSSVVNLGAQLLLNLNISFKSPAFKGPKGIWMAAETLSLQLSPWVALGAWQVP